jgi:hypothetical protein
MTWLSTVWPERGATRQRGHAQQHRAQDHAEQQFGSFGPADPRRLEQRYPVGNRLDPGQCAAACGERLQQQQQAQRLHRACGQQRAAQWRGVQRQRVDQADGEDGEQPDDENHSGQQKRPRRITKTAQVDQGDHGENSQADRHRRRAEAREGRGQRRRPSRDGDRDGERVVHDKRRRGDQADPWPEVVQRYRVRAAAARVGVDDLPVGKHQDRKQHDDRDRDRQHQMQRPGPCYGENRDDGFRPVRDGRQGIQGQCGQPFHRGNLLAGDVPCPNWRPD